MAALPGIKDLSEFGITVETDSGTKSKDSEAIRLEREREWALAERISTLRFRRNMTGFAGILSLVAFLVSSIYLFLFPHQSITEDIFVCVLRLILIIIMPLRCTMTSSSVRSFKSRIPPNMSRSPFVTASVL